MAAWERATRGHTDHVAIARRDDALRRLRRATGIIMAAAVVSVGGVSALAAATRPGTARPTGPSGSSTAPESSTAAPQPPPAAPESQSEQDEQAPGALAPGQAQSGPPPVTSGGS